MLAFFSWILPWIRTSGWLERDEARRHRGRSGIVFGFRGPPGGQVGVEPTAGWYVVDLAIDGEVRLEIVATNGRPRWCGVEPGLHAIEVIPRDPGGRAMSVSVELVVPEAAQVIVAVWPEVRRFAGDIHPARIEVRT